MVFGHNSNFPSVLNNQLTAQNGVASSELIAYYLNSLHAARKRFIKINADEKLWRILKLKTNAISLIYQSGDKSYK